MTTPRRFALLAALPLLAALLMGAQSAAAWVEGVTSPVRTYRLSPPVDEVVTQVLVRPGDAVEAGQPLVRFYDLDARARVELLELRVESTIRRDAAKATWELSRLEEQDMRAALEQGAVKLPELRRTELRTTRDRLLYEQAEEEAAELALQLRSARGVLARRTLLAPASGVVVAVGVEAGERAQPGTPVVEMVDTSSLHAEVGVPASVAAGVHRGDAVRVVLERAGMEDRSATGTVLFVSPVIDIGAGSRDQAGQRRVLVEVPNTEGDAAGGLLRVTFEPAASGG